jgi:hypothetical protein
MAAFLLAQGAILGQRPPSRRADCSRRRNPPFRILSFHIWKKLRLCGLNGTNSAAPRSD